MSQQSSGTQRTKFAKVSSRIQLNKSSSSNTLSNTFKAVRSKSAQLISNTLSENSSDGVTKNNAKVGVNIGDENEIESLHSDTVSYHTSYSKDKFEECSDLAEGTAEAKVQTSFGQSLDVQKKSQATILPDNSQRIKSAENKSVSSKSLQSKNSVQLGNVALERQKTHIKTPLKLNPYNAKLNILKKFNLTTKNNWQIKHSNVWKNLDTVKDTKEIKEQRKADLHLKLDYGHNAKSVVRENILNAKQRNLIDILKKREVKWTNTKPIFTKPKLASFSKGKEGQFGHLQNILARTNGGASIKVVSR